MNLRGIDRRSGLSRILAALAVALVLGSPGAASAQGTAEERVACTPDVLRLCSGSIPDVASIIACLKANGPRLSAPCHQVMFPPPEKSRSSAALETPR